MLIIYIVGCLIILFFAIMLVYFFRMSIKEFDNRQETNSKCDYCNSKVEETKTNVVDDFPDKCCEDCYNKVQGGK